MQKSLITFSSALVWALTSCASAPAPLPVDTRSDEPAHAVDVTAVPAAALATPADWASTPRQGESGGGWNGSFSGFIGYRVLDEDTWGSDGDIVDLSKQIAVGVEAEFRPPQSVLGFEVGAGYSYWQDSVSSVDVEGMMYEIYAGPRVTVGEEGVRPYVGAGVTYLVGEIKVDGFDSDDEDSIAGYAHIGVLFDLSEGFHIGIDGRATFGSDFTPDGATGDANGDYYQGAVMLGTHW